MVNRSCASQKSSVFAARQITLGYGWQTAGGFIDVDGVEVELISETSPSALRNFQEEQSVVLPPIRLLRISDVPDTRTGGSARFVHFNNDELLGAGHQIDLLWQEDLLPRVPKRLRRFLLPLHIVQLIHQRIQAGVAYDIVEIHEPLAAAYAAARRFNRSFPPLLVLSHGVASHCRQAMLDYFDRKGVSLSLKERYGSLITMIWQANFALRHADQILLSATSDREYLEQSLGIASERVTIVNGGVSERFLACPLGPSPGSGILFFGTWIDRKGTRDLVQVFSHIAREFPGYRLTVAGCGIAPEVVLAAFPPDCRQSIQVLPQVKGDEALLSLYRAHGIFFAPSVCEGQLLTMLEAAAAGLTLVCTSTGGMKDFVRPRENGLLATVGDVSGFTNAVAEVVRNPSLAASLGAQAQRDARKFTWKRSAMQFLTGVSTALQRRKGRRKAHLPLPQNSLRD